MSTKDQIRLEIMEYLTAEEGLTRSGKKELLEALFQKHFAISDSDLILNKHDFNQIISSAKHIMSTISLPTFIGSSSVDSHEVHMLCCSEATIQILNSKGAFRRLPKFNK